MQYICPRFFARNSDSDFDSDSEQQQIAQCAPTHPDCPVPPRIQTTLSFGWDIRNRRHEGCTNAVLWSEAALCTILLGAIDECSFIVG
jgi:hypothetical protein